MHAAVICGLLTNALNHEFLEEFFLVGKSLQDCELRPSARSHAPLWCHHENSAWRHVLLKIPTHASRSVTLSSHLKWNETMWILRSHQHLHVEQDSLQDCQVAYAEKPASFLRREVPWTLLPLMVGAFDVLPDLPQTQWLCCHEEQRGSILPSR